MQTKGVILKKLKRFLSKTMFKDLLSVAVKVLRKPIFLNISKNLISLFLTISDQIRALRIWLLRQSFSKRTIAIL